MATKVRYFGIMISYAADNLTIMCCACFGFDVDAAQLADIFVKAGQ